MIPHERLDEVAEFLDGMRRDVPEASRRPGPYPYFGAHGQQGTIDAHLFDEPLVLLAEELSGHVASGRPLAQLIDGKTWVSKRIHVVRAGPRLDPAFLCRALEQIDVSHHASGARRDRLTRAHAGEIRVPVPPLDDQRRIAAVLGQADFIRERRWRSRGQLDAFVRVYFLEHFGDPQSNPRRWPRLAFGALGENHGTVRSLIGALDAKAQHGAPRSASASPALDASQDARARANELSLDGERLLVAEAGSNLVTRLDPVSRVVAGRVAADRHAHVIAANGCADLHYLHHALELMELKPYLTSTTRPRLKRAALERIPVPVPPLEQQRAFRALTEKAQALKTLQDLSCERLDELYAALRLRALRGAPLTADR